MAPGILGKKVGMTQIFDDQGRVVPVTVLQAGPCVVVQRKTASRDGYEAIQVGLVDFLREKLVKKPVRGHWSRCAACASSACGTETRVSSRATAFWPTSSGRGNESM